MHKELTTFQGSYLTPAYERATVADAMRPGLFACDPGNSLVDVARLMADRHVHCVAVITTGDRKLHGVVSGLDLLRAASASGPTTAADIAGVEYVTSAPEDRLSETVDRMVHAGSAHAIVMREGVPVGVLSSADVAGILAWGRA